MNREQCQAILANIELIRHFAAGGDIGHRSRNCVGEILPTRPAKSIGLSGLRSDGGTYYLMVKPKFKLNSHTKKMERLTRCWPEIIRDDEIIVCKSGATC